MGPSIAAIALCAAYAAPAAAGPPRRTHGDGELLAQYHDPSSPPPPPTGTEVPTAEPPAVVVDAYGGPIAPGVAASPAAPPPGAGLGLVYGGSLFVPIWVGDIQHEVGAGIGLLGRLGYELGHGASIEGGFGWMYSPGREALHRERDLSNLFFTVGPRYGFLNPSALVPFVEAAFQLNFFDACYPDRYGYSYCGGYAADVTVGFNAGAGLLFEIGRFFSLELGASVTGTPEGDVLDVARSDSDFWFFVSPFAGFRFYD